jgi:hypothetical protein
MIAARVDALPRGLLWRMSSDLRNQVTTSRPIPLGFGRDYWKLLNTIKARRIQNVRPSKKQVLLTAFNF